MRLSEALRTGPGLQWAVALLSLSILPAENHALGEIARQQVDRLIREGRLHLEPVRSVLDQAPEQGMKAILCLVAWLLAVPASYGRGFRSIKSPGSGFASAPEGPPLRPPFRRDE